MTLLKWKNDNQLAPSFNSLFNEWFKDDYFDKFSFGTSIPAVNVKESEKDYTISLAAPGMKKNNFNISLENNILSISSVSESESESAEENKFTRKEYNYSSFSRSFTLPEIADIEKIDAKYEDGELIVSIPKSEQTTNKVKQIAIK